MITVPCMAFLKVDFSQVYTKINNVLADDYLGPVT